jgi:hypothetical protein
VTILGRTCVLVLVGSTSGALALSVGCGGRPAGGTSRPTDADIADTTNRDDGGADTSAADLAVPDATAGDTTVTDAGVPDTTTGDAARADGRAGDANTPDATEPAAGDLCTSTGMSDFGVHGVGFDAWNGAKIGAAAVEPTFDEKAFPVVVRQTTVIAGGAFAMACPLSLSTNSSYPSVGLFIDADGDGHCSPSDLGYEFLLFAWSSTIDRAFTSAMSKWPTIGGRPGGISNSTPFCAYYGF